MIRMKILSLVRNANTVLLCAVVAFMFVMALLTSTVELTSAEEEKPVFTKEDCNCPGLGIDLDPDSGPYSTDNVLGLTCKYRSGTKNTRKTIQFQVIYFYKAEEAERFYRRHAGLDYDSRKRDLEKRRKDKRCIIIEDEISSLERHSYLYQSLAYKANEPRWSTGKRYVRYGDHYIISIESLCPGFVNPKDFLRAFNVLEKHAMEIIESDKITLSLINEKLNAYTLEEAWPEVKFKISNIAREKVIYAYSFRVSFNLKMSGKNNLYKWQLNTMRYDEYPLSALYSPLKWVDKQSVVFSVPLYVLLKNCFKLEPYQFLALKQLDPSNIKGMPDEMEVELTLQPLEICITEGSPNEEKIDISSSPVKKAVFKFGSEIVLGPDTKLKVGKNPEVAWQDVGEIVIVGIKKVTKLETVGDIADLIVEATGIYESATGDEFNLWGIGEALVDIVGNLYYGGYTDVIFMVPEVYRIADAMLAPTTVVQKTEIGLRCLGYCPMSGFGATKEHPIWVNLYEEKLALIDPAGIVHQVKAPENFHISAPYFTVPQHSVMIAMQASYAMKDKKGAFTTWSPMNKIQTEELSIVPPPLVNNPVRVKLKPTPLGPPTGFTKPTQLTIRTAKKGVLELSSTTERDALLDFGWEDDSGLVLKAPYACLVQGALTVKTKEDTARLGCGVYKQEKGGRIRYIPKVWFYSSGTEYTIQTVPDQKGFKIDVKEGRVEVKDSGGNSIGMVNTGENKVFSFPPPPRQVSREPETRRIETEIEPQLIRKRETRPKAKIHRVWVDHNAYQNRQKGMRIHTKFNVENLKGKEIEAVAYFHYQDGKGLKDFDGRYKTKSGKVAVYKCLQPKYDNTVWNDLQLFIPYNQLHMSRNVKHNLKFNVIIWDLSGPTSTLLDMSDWTEFLYKH